MLQRQRYMHKKTNCDSVVCPSSLYTSTQTETRVFTLIYIPNLFCFES